MCVWGGALFVIIVCGVAMLFYLVVCVCGGGGGMLSL